MKSVYLAARYSRRDEMRVVAKQLTDLGFEVTSRWLEEKGPLLTQLGDDSPEFYLTTALIDIADIDRADSIVFLSEDPLVGTPRGGRHVEFGYALGTRKHLIVVGGTENIFHYLPSVSHFSSLDDFFMEFQNGPSSN